MKDKKRILVFAIIVVIFVLLIVVVNKVKKDAIKQKQSSMIYDTAPISSAYLNNDTSKLSDYQKKIYDKATEVLDMVITDGMTDCEKELAIHDYLIYNVTYDEDKLVEFNESDEDTKTPYGTLYNHRAICSGYTSSFQMFMDMLEIPCKTIVAKDAKDTDHMWNMVQLDGDWYYVDCTWDDPLPDTETSETHMYFNVTEKFMKENDHIWDKSDLPKAEATKYAYDNVVKKEEK